MIGTPDERGELVHRRLHFFRARIVNGIDGLSHLEEDVGILRRSAEHGMIRRKRALAMLENALHINEHAHVVFGKHFDLVDFMRSAESVEEMQKGNARRKRHRLRDQRSVVRLLHRGGRQHGEAGAAHRHHVGVVAEDRQ